MHVGNCERTAATGRQQVAKSYNGERERRCEGDTPNKDPFVIFRLSIAAELVAVIVNVISFIPLS